MSNFWWFDPSWGDATCAFCGANIKETGGDPDWGKCYDCFSQELEERERFEIPFCDICGEGEAVADCNGKAVCSKECYDEAKGDNP